MPRKQTSKVVSKEWYEVEAPKYLRNMHIGEVLSSDPKKLVGRKLRVSLSEITSNVRLQGVNVIFQIFDVSNKKAKTKVVGYEMSHFIVKRYVSRRRSKLDDSFIVKTKDGINVRVKPLIITVFKTKGVVKKKIRLRAREELFKAISNLRYEEFVSSVINHKLQVDVRSKINKTYPIKNFEIRRFEITRLKPTKIKTTSEEKEKGRKEEEESSVGEENTSNNEGKVEKVVNKKNKEVNKKEVTA